MKKKFSNLFVQHPFLSTFGILFSIVLLLFFLNKLHTDKVILKENINYFERITGYKMNPDEDYVYESVRAFNGDGYSIWTYNLSDSDAEYFKKPDTLLFSQYPKVGEYRTHWNHHKWKRGPFQDKYQQYLHLALTVAGPDDKYKLELRKNWFDRIRSMLASENCLYAFNFTEHKPNSYPGNVDFYIISPSQKILIVINHNT